jgi:RNA polymerase sigma factor (sigma-70 family)
MNEKAKINATACYDTKLLLVRRLLVRYIKSRIFNKQDAEDLVQNVLIILSKKMNEFDANKSFCSWAFSICNFQIKAYFSKSKRNKIVSILDEENMSPESLGYFCNRMPFQDLIQEEKQKVTTEIMNKLNTMEKKVFSLSLKGFGSKDIIYSLKITPSNYSVSKSRALKKAKTLFADKSIKNYKI